MNLKAVLVTMLLLMFVAGSTGVYVFFLNREAGIFVGISLALMLMIACAGMFLAGIPPQQGAPG